MKRRDFITLLGSDQPKRGSCYSMVSAHRQRRRSHAEKSTVARWKKDQESAFDLIFGLGALNESQAGVHSHFGNSTARQFGGGD
jgi:hypothetical protein